MKETSTDGTQYRGIIDSISAPAYLLDSSWNIAYTNRESLPQPDVSLESYRGGYVMDLIAQIAADDESHATFRQAIETVYEQDAPGDFPFEVTLDIDTSNGTTTRQYRCSPCELTAGTGVIVVSEPVTDPKSQELARYEGLCETLPVAVWISSPEAQGQFEFVNEAAVDMFNADSKEELKAHSRQGLYANTDEQVELGEQIVADGAVTEYETVLLTLDEEAIWGSVTAELTEIDGDDQIVGIIENVTDRKQKERALQEERAFIDGIVDGLPDIFYTFDTEWSLIEYNEKASAVTGYDHQELESMAPWDFFPDTEQEMIRNAVKQMTKSEEQIDSLEAHLQTKAGDEIPYEFSMAPFYDANGTVVGFTGVARDITDRKQQERELEEKRERLQVLFDTAPDPIFVTDADGKFTKVNEKATAKLGYSEEELLEMEVADIDAEIDRSDAREFHSMVKEKGEPMELEGRHQCADGSSYPVKVRFTLLETDGQDLFLSHARDVTQQKESKQKLRRQNERLEKFASVISHDLRNPIGLAEGYVDIAEESGDPDDFQTIRKALGRMDTMIEELLTMAGADTVVEDREPIELVVLAHEAWRMAQTEDATLEMMIDSQARITGDRDLLLNVFENLFRNAVDHNEPPLTVRVGTLDDGRSGFYIEDDGDGIPEDAREEIFDHGHTTSDDGTGLGLYIVKELVTAHGWEISATGGHDGGARFEIETERQDKD
ncbi:MAG: PAS sensor histidine kinase [uncultured archaeon A07HN63]|nr:MAG: PAS sensor histidine kinase [uncultured archaeon A07HN63]